MRQRLIKASVPTDFSSDILEVNANDLSNEVFQSISTNKNILQDIIFNNGQNFLNYINTNYIQDLVNEYMGKNQKYDADQLNDDADNLTKAIYNNICNKLEAMSLNDILSYFGLALIQQ